MPHRKHDLESLVRTVMSLFYKIKLPLNLSEGDLPTLAKKARKFWKIVDEELSIQYPYHGKIWKEALEITREKNVKDKINKLENTFSKLEFPYLNFKKIHDKFETIFPLEIDEIDE